MTTFWEDDSVQFPRLVAEIEANGGFTMMLIADLGISMDLPEHRVLELIERAQTAWEKQKEKLRQAEAQSESERPDPRE